MDEVDKCAICDHNKVCLSKFVENGCGLWTGWTDGDTPPETGEYLIETKKGATYVTRYYDIYGWNGQFKNCVAKWRRIP